MIRTFTLFTLCGIFISLHLAAQVHRGFASVESLAPISITDITAEKPQSKVWKYNCTYWSVLPDSEGTHIWRLDGITWTKALTISPHTTGKADCKVVGNVVHILLFRGGTESQLISMEYVPMSNTYKPWTTRTSVVPIRTLYGTATIDIDSKGRMWLISNSNEQVTARWSDSPYSTWSAPITLTSKLYKDDIGAVIAMQGKIGVFWTDQITKRFGFKTHVDGTDPSNWTANEIPAAKSALNVGDGMADDHINMALAKDGTLYCAVKTGYNTLGYPQIGLLVRRPSGTWDNMYKISETGTRPIVILNEELNNIKVIYTSIEGGGDILYNESSVPDISFGETQILLDGKYDNPTSTKDNYDSETVVLVSNKTKATGLMLTTGLTPKECKLDLNEMFMVYPNPFSLNTTILFILANGGDYTITLYDTKGARIAVLGQGTAVANEPNTIKFESDVLARGLYMIRLRAPGIDKTLKVVHEQ